MDIIQNSFSFEEVLAENNFVLVFLTGKDCSVCHVLKPKIEKLVTENFSDIKTIEILTGKLPDLAARLSVFTVPVILFYVEGREYLREVRFIDITLLYQKLEKILGMYKQYEEK